MMNSKIYGKLAVTNLKNNRKSYIPYILASAFSVMMYFIMDNLYRNRSLVEKGSPLAIMLSYADAVLLIFSIIFLFYINREYIIFWEWEKDILAKCFFLNL